MKYSVPDVIIRDMLKCGKNETGKNSNTEFFSNFLSEPNLRGAGVPQIWQQWLITNKPEILARIALHCLSDLLRERQLVRE